jgi:hypothetical protein
VTAVREYDLYSEAFRADTYETFARMRAEDPVLCQPGLDGESPIWFVTRARLEAEIAIGTLLRRLPGLRLAIPEEELRWRPVPLFRSLVELPVAWNV